MDDRLKTYEDVLSWLLLLPAGEQADMPALNAEQEKQRRKRQRPVSDEDLETYEQTVRILLG